MVSHNFRARGVVKGGGGLFMTSPVDGYSVEEMNRLARERLRYNRKRAALKNMCHIMSSDARQLGLEGVIDRRQLDRNFAAARLNDPATPGGTMPVPGHLVSTRTFASATPRGTNVKGRPVKVAWQEMVDSVPFPSMPPPQHPTSGFRAPELRCGRQRAHT